MILLVTRAPYVEARGEIHEFLGRDLPNKIINMQIKKTTTKKQQQQQNKNKNKTKKEEKKHLPQ